jgi:hypothetical protein
MMRELPATRKTKLNASIAERKANAEKVAAPRSVFVDLFKPVPIPYVCERCKARRARMVELRKVVHANYESPKLCPACEHRVRRDVGVAAQ